MENLQSAVESLVHGSNTLFILIGAIMVLFMHAGFAFLEVGTVRQKNQVNALSKILSDFAISTLVYFFTFCTRRRRSAAITATGWSSSSSC